MKTLIHIAIYLTVLGFTGVCLLLSYWYIWLALAAGGLIILVFWHAKATAYHCPRCGYEFKVSPLTDFLSPHGVDRKGGWKYLECPNCSNRSRMMILIKITEKRQSTKRFHRRSEFHNYRLPTIDCV